MYDGWNKAGSRRLLSGPAGNGMDLRGTFKGQCEMDVPPELLHRVIR
jgi:hypothetical protein